jgi:hypothetical protein
MTKTQPISLKESNSKLKIRYYLFKAWLADFYWPLMRFIPYDWRPGQIWYRILCFCWYRYTTVKPRTLNYHTWCDRDKLLVHTMFEILSQFIEKECSPGHVDWQSTNQHALARQELQTIYDWWYNVYLKTADHCFDEYYNFMEKHSNGNFIKDIEFDIPNGKEKSAELRHDAIMKDRELAETLKSMLKRLIDVHEFMWT